MLSARWAHRALIGFCVLLVVGVIVYLAHLGWLGPQLQEWSAWCLEPITKRIQSFEHMDRLARLLGAVGTLLTAAVGVYKGIYYADRNLPERLRQLLERTDARLRKDRDQLLRATTGTGIGARTQRALFYEGPLNSALNHLGFPKLEPADKELQNVVTEIEKKMKVALCQQRVLEEQKVTAHILRGSIASTRAEEKARLGKLPDNDREAAEVEYSSALLLRPQDLDALELRGRQRDLRGHIPGAEEDFGALIDAAQLQGNLLRAVRGQRLLAQMKERNARTNAQRQATRTCYLDGIAMLKSKGSLLEADYYEKGLLYLGCARVQVLLKIVNRASANLRVAIDSFKLAPSWNTATFRNEAEQLLASITPPADPSETNKSPKQRKLSWLRQFLGR